MESREVWTEAEQDGVWETGEEIEGMDPELFRKDAAGALMQRDAYGMKHRFGWEIDASAEKSAARPLFWKNAQARREPAGPRKFFRYQPTFGLNVKHFFADDV